MENDVFQTLITCRCYEIHTQPLRVTTEGHLTQDSRNEFRCVLVCRIITEQIPCGGSTVYHRLIVVPKKSERV